MYTYLLINLFTIIIPLLFSFERRISFYSKWRYLFPSIALTGIFFIIWDIYFTRIGIWGFNPSYLTGIYLADLPISEWLFFFSIPYACLFTYEAFKKWLPNNFLVEESKIFTWTMIGLLIVIVVLKPGKLYTSSTFLLLSIYLLLHLFYLKSNYLGKFYITYLVILIPFFIVNGILTGSWIEDEVVWYNNQENLNFRIGTIPIEDIFYGALLILMNVTFYEEFQTDRSNQSR